VLDVFAPNLYLAADLPGGRFTWRQIYLAADRQACRPNSWGLKLGGDLWWGFG